MKYLSILIPILFMLNSGKAQKNTQGFYLGLSLIGGEVYYEEDNLSNKDPISGLDLRLGYGISKTVTLFVGLGGYEADGKEQDQIRDKYFLSQFEIGAKFHLGNKDKNPNFYLESSLQGAVADYSKEFNLKLSGGGLGLGGGVLLYIGDVLAIDIGLHGSYGTINNIEIGNTSTNIRNEDFGYGFNRLSVGIAYYPFRQNTSSE